MVVAYQVTPEKLTPQIGVKFETHHVQKGKSLQHHQ